MTKTKSQPDLDSAIRARILSRAHEIARDSIMTLRIVENELGSGNHISALSAIESLEQKTAAMRSLLFLLR